MDFWPMTTDAVAPATEPRSKRWVARLPLLMLSCVVLAQCERRNAAPAPHGSPALPAIPSEAHLAAGAIVPPGGTLMNPHRGDATAANNGQRLFATMNCEGCHAPDASGLIGPSLTDGRWRYGGADGEIFSSIYYGRPRGMPAFGGVLGPEGVWALVTYLTSLPVPRDIATESWENP